MMHWLYEKWTELENTSGSNYMKSIQWPLICDMDITVFEPDIVNKQWLVRGGLRFYGNHSH